MSAYVPQYQYDIFVSYADVDNEIFPGKDQGWVTTLIDTLKIFLAQEIGSKDAFSLCSKAMLGGNIPSTYNSIEYLENSAVFLLILSPAYLKSEKCNLELNAFLAKVGENSDRIFIVEYKAAERLEILSDLRGYIFWETDSNRHRKYSLNFDSKQYHEKTEDLASDIVNTLKTLNKENIPCKESENKLDENWKIIWKETISNFLKTISIFKELISFIVKRSYSDSEKVEELKADTISEVNNDLKFQHEDSLLRWWNQLDDNWKRIFKKAISIKVDPSYNDLEKILNLQQLYCQENKISDLEPLRPLNNLQVLDCRGNEISTLEPICTLTNLHRLNCSWNKISNLEPLRPLKNLHTLDCSWNEISNLEPLESLKNLDILYCIENEISDLELDKFKKALPNCEVKS
jgi:hypothetical protein